MNNRVEQANDRFNWFWQWANPTKFMSLTGSLLPWLVGGTLITLLPGLIWGFFFTTPAVNFGSSVKIIYVHVPSAIMAISAWYMMLAASVIWLVRRHHVSALAAKAAAPVGVVFTMAALVTGAIWGQPMWGTYWAWDPRLTSFLILFLFYLGYMALWASIENPETAADLTAVTAIVGSVFATLSRYAVNFWNQGLHQGASLSLDRDEHVADSYWVPLVLCIIGVFLLFVLLVFVRTRTELRLKRLNALEMRERMRDA
ncbi:MAG: transcriptional regulator [Rhodobacterales bacterium]|nr:MAG: transcriptional regulator [Rhodobacterales bacterium]PIE12581.1 MAG: transcriptional regulator [Rhodobacterales bacterium]